MILPRLFPSSFKSRTSPVTDENIQTATADLITIQELLPILPSIQTTSDTLTILRIIGVLYVPYLILTYLFPFSVLFGVVGSFVLTWRAPWAKFIRVVLWRSAFAREVINKLWVFISGSQLPSVTIEVLSEPQVGDSMRFMFTVLENQRWWVGLDWTAALLPNERPSWCSPSLQPVSPPMGFELPDPAVVILPDKKSPTGKSKRIASWGWEEPDWKVLIRQEGRTIRVERPLPKEDSGPNGSVLSKVANKMKDAHPPTPPENHPEAPNEVDDNDLTTDPDGWIYGDNKWEKQTAKGGYGKYTRYRKWTRVAVVTEIVRVAAEGDIAQMRTGVDTGAINQTRKSNAVDELEGPRDIKQRLRIALDKSQT